jgi:tetratricopeptide (TPR) repeat protein
VFRKSELLALKALELNENLAEAHASLGDLSMHFRRDWQKAESELKNAISLKPSYAPAHHWYSEYLACIGRLDEALNENQRALDLDPLSLIVRDYRGKLLYCSRRYTDAENVYRQVLQNEPNHAIAYKGLSEVHTFSGQYEIAIAEAENATELSGGSIFMKDDLGYIYAKAGRRAEAYSVIDELKKASPAKFVPAYGIAVIYLELGERDVGMEWLEKAVDQGTSPIELLKIDPVFESVRADPKFLDILEKMNLN